MYDKIALMLPTYGRSETYLPRFIETAAKTSSPDRVRFVFCINTKDVKTSDMLKDNYYLQAGICPFEYTVVPENLPSPNLATYFNLMYEKTKEFGDNCVISQLGDDMEFRTPGWDQKLLDAINAYDGIGVFWCNDDYIAGERCPVNLFVTRKMVEATEHPFMADEFAADMIDYIWGKIGKYTETSHYFPDIHIWHNHSTNLPPEQRDATFQRLSKIQDQAHKIGKARAREIAHEIAEILISKGFKGNSI
jgi:hypothetical protein